MTETCDRCNREGEIEVRWGLTTSLSGIPTPALDRHKTFWLCRRHYQKVDVEKAVDEAWEKNRVTGS